MEELMKELNSIKKYIPYNTYRTIKGQMKSGNVEAARTGIRICWMKKIFCLRTGQDNEHVQGLCTSVFYAKNDMLKECAQKIRIV